LGPLELQISTLQKQVEASNNSIIELQQFWLRNQSELVKTVQRVGQQSEEIKSLKKQYNILRHKKQRTEGESFNLYPNYRCSCWCHSGKYIYFSRLMQYAVKTVAIDTPGGKRHLKMKIKAQQMTFRQDITKYKMYWLTFRCIVHNIFRAIKLIYKRVLYIYIYIYM
jgi:hypothetical protein